MNKCDYCNRKIDKYVEIFGKKMCRTCFLFFSYLLKNPNSITLSKIWDAWRNGKEKIELRSISFDLIKFLENKVGLKVEYKSYYRNEAYRCVVYFKK